LLLAILLLSGDQAGKYLIDASGETRFMLLPSELMRYIEPEESKTILDLSGDQSDDVTFAAPLVRSTALLPSESMTHMSLYRSDGTLLFELMRKNSICDGGTVSCTGFISAGSGETGVTGAACLVGVMLDILPLFSTILLSKQPGKTHIRNMIRKIDPRIEKQYLYILKHSSHSQLCMLAHCIAGSD
jgi:hypothetical protein